MDGKKIRKIGYNALISLLLLTAATGIGYLFQSNGLLDTNIVMIYMLCVLFVTSMTEGFVYGIIAAVLAMGAFNYFFVTPYYSLNVDHPSYLTAMVSMLFAALVTSMITSKSKMNEKEAREREFETSTLLGLTNQMTEADSMEEIAVNVVKYTSSILKCDIACMITQEDGRLCSRYLRRVQGDEQRWEKLKEQEELERDFSNPDRPEYRDGPEYRDWPVYGQKGLLGALRIPLAEAGKLKQEQIRLFVSMKETASLAMEHRRVLEQQIHDNELVVKERYRSTLLRSISHDFRTPLAGIMGTCGILLDMMGETDEKSRLVWDISRDAQWLYELVENVLSLTRLREGELIHKEPEACEEVIETAIRRIRGRSGKRRLRIEVPQECLVVPMDIRLIEQVLVNLLDNAVKHTAEDGEISVTVEQRKEDAVFEVMDDGEGISKEDLPYLFQLFYTTHGVHTDKKKGTGIGLEICESIVRAHGGKIYAMAREDKSGAVFQFTIPTNQAGRKEGQQDDAKRDNTGY